MTSNYYYKYDMRISLINSNYNALSEHMMLAYLGDFQWQSISKKIGIPLAKMRTIDDGEVYGTFFYIEVKIPNKTSLKKFQLDQKLTCFNFIKGLKNISVRGDLIFDHAENINENLLKEASDLPEELKEKHPYVLFGNIFISPDGSNEILRIAPSVIGDFKKIPKLLNKDNPYNLTRECKEKNSFSMFDSKWEIIIPRGPSHIIYEINPDRDSNGAGLVYFVSYISFMDYAERRIMSDYNSYDFSKKIIDTRSTFYRKLGYFGNAGLEDKIIIELEIFCNQDRKDQIGLRHIIKREKDRKIICISECIKKHDVA